MISVCSNAANVWHSKKDLRPIPRIRAEPLPTKYFCANTTLAARVAGGLSWVLGSGAFIIKFATGDFNLRFSLLVGTAGSHRSTPFHFTAMQNNELLKFMPYVCVSPASCVLGPVSCVLGDGKNYLILPVLADEARQVEALFGLNPWRALDMEFNLVPAAAWKGTRRKMPYLCWELKKVVSSKI